MHAPFKRIVRYLTGFMKNTMEHKLGIIRMFTSQQIYWNALQNFYFSCEIHLNILFLIVMVRDHGKRDKRSKKRKWGEMKREKYLYIILNMKVNTST